MKKILITIIIILLVFGRNKAEGDELFESLEEDETLSCYISNGQSRWADSDGQLLPCPGQANRNRFCLKFTSDRLVHNNKVFRGCDYSFEFLMNFDLSRPSGCYEYDNFVRGQRERGVYCICQENGCNDGTVELEEDDVKQDSQNVTSINEN